MLNPTEADSAARYVLKNWDHLKAVIEGVRVEEEVPVPSPDPGYTLSAPCAVDLMRTGRCVESVGIELRHKCRMSGERVISDYGWTGSDMGVKAWLGAYSDVRYRMCDCGCFPTATDAPAASPETA